LVLLLVRQAPERDADSARSFYTSLLDDPGVLHLALTCLRRPQTGFVDWHQPGFLPLYQAAVACAHTAEAIALATDRSGPQQAWVGGLLAPLGWLAAAAVADPSAACGPAGGDLDPPAIARRLAAAWQLPAWLSTVVGHLGLPLEAARHLGADPDRFRITQLAVSLVEQAYPGLRLPVGGTPEDLAHALDLTPGTLQTIRASVSGRISNLSPPRDWKAPASMPLLPELLRLAAENRRLAAAEERASWQAAMDALHDACQRQYAGERQRLHDKKMRALAEFAAGAGHEINNPLAVISGQAQYLLLAEQEPARRKALQTIVGQTQRIHLTLTQLMQFARPPVPQPERVDLGGLLREVVDGLQDLADEHQVRLSSSDPAPAVTLLVDPGQMRTALSALVRNAIEAAPPSGWASVSVEGHGPDGLCILVEDSGPGPAPADRDHLFDPFYSGRTAGRGCGLGLSTAWQLARQHGGDVQLDAGAGHPTRFVLTLPPEAILVAASHNGVNGCHALRA
jgi:signal transduction histidine kinase